MAAAFRVVAAIVDSAPFQMRHRESTVTASLDANPQPAGNRNRINPHEKNYRAERF